MKDYLSIQEFSKLSGIPPSTLRYWDEIRLFSPRRRHPESSYRYYTPDQMITVKFIAVLSEMKVPLKSISEAAQNHTPEAMLSVIEQQEVQLQKEMHELSMRYSIMFARREQIRCGMRANEQEISVMERDAKAYISGNRNEYKSGETFFGPFTRFCQAAKELRINLSLPIGGYHDNINSYLKNTGKPDYFFSLDPNGDRILPAGCYLTGFKRGYYGEMDDLPERLVTYADENALMMTGPVYVLYLFDEICVHDPSQYLAQAIVSVTKKMHR
ncbi:MAG: MerR family transcriptional regulator [Clostridia bacterium]|nr:MerR family transcriptional regulator [Clostridia bacterium]